MSNNDNESNFCFQICLNNQNNNRAASRNRRNTIIPELAATTIKIVIGFDNSSIMKSLIPNKDRFNCCGLFFFL
jgi:hypothetical protein